MVGVKWGWGVKIGGSRGPKWRPDPILGPYLAILSHFWPVWAFFTLFGHLGVGQRLQVDPDPYSWRKMGVGSQNWWVLNAQVASRPYYGAIFGHFEPILALLGLF